MIRLVILAAFAWAIAGCSQLGGSTDDAQKARRWADWQQSMQRVNSWNMHARAAITMKGEAYNVGLRWERDAQRFMMLLEAPFGQGVFRIDATETGAYQLRLPDGRHFVNASPEALLEDVIGWSLPIGGLEYWIRGLPWPRSEYKHRIDRHGRARSIGQDRWNIDYLDYFDSPPQAPLPRRIRLSRDELTLKLVIERWQRPEIEQTPSDLFPEFN